MRYTPEQLRAAIDRARPGTFQLRTWYAQSRDAHLDTLARLLDLHRSTTTQHACHAGCHGSWPCPSVGLVVDALRQMGAM